jgi:hypothetical protein
MKKKKIPFYPKIYFVCTDGSTIQNDFLYYKDDFYLNPDIKSNALWLPEIEGADLEKLSHKSTKFAKYEFNFKSLISEK